MDKWRRKKPRGTSFHHVTSQYVALCLSTPGTEVLEQIQQEHCTTTTQQRQLVCETWLMFNKRRTGSVKNSQLWKGKELRSVFNQALWVNQVKPITVLQQTCICCYFSTVFRLVYLFFSPTKAGALKGFGPCLLQGRKTCFSNVSPVIVYLTHLWNQFYPPKKR